MEHRWSERTPVPIAVTVYSRGTPLLTTVTRNLSRQGALLNAKPADIGNARSVELSFEFGKGKRVRQLRLPAYVIHRHGGIGLMFTENSATTLRELERMLRAALTASTPAQAER